VGNQVFENKFVYQSVTALEEPDTQFMS